MDWFVMKALVRQLRQELLHSVVNKVFQPEQDLVILKLWNGHRTLNLLLCVKPGEARFHLTTRSYPNPVRPPRFCQLLRSRLERLAAIELDECERVLSLEFTSADSRSIRLVADFRGAQANLCCLDSEGKMIDALRRSGPRALGGGAIAEPYERALKSERIPLRRLGESWPEEIAADELPSWLLSNVAPMNASLAHAICEAVSRGGNIQELLEEVVSKQLKNLEILVDDDRSEPRLRTAPITGTSAENNSSQLVDDFYHDQRRIAVGDLTSLVRCARKYRARLLKRLEHIEKDRQRIALAEIEREAGDLILAQLYRIKKGMVEVELDDYFHDGETRRLELKPHLDPAANAQHYFKLYRKAHGAVEHIDRRDSQTRDELVWIEDVLHALDENPASEQILSIRSELIEAGLFKQRIALAPRQRDRTQTGVEQGEAPSGLIFLMGKNNHANDQVSRTLAQKGDLWFHAKGLPGSHLVLKTQGHPPAEEDVLFVAALAAGHSRGRQEDKVEVMIAAAEQVRKPKGSRPGAVTVASYRTVVVSPARFEDLKKNRS